MTPQNAFFRPTLVFFLGFESSLDSTLGHCGRGEKHWRLNGWGQIRNGANVTHTTAQKYFHLIL